MTAPLAPPPPPPPPSRRVVKWLIGCGAGCLVLIVLLVAVFAVGVHYAAKHAKAQRESQGIRGMYNQSKQRGKVPADQKPLLDHLVDLATSDKASMYAAGLTAAVLGTVLADGIVTPDEEKTVQEVVAMLEANPDITWEQHSKFFEEHPAYGKGRAYLGDPGTGSHSSLDHIFLLSPLHRI